MNAYSKTPNTVTKVEDLDAEYGRYTYSDYLTWRFDEMVELIKGRIFKMSPAPAPRHQLISSNLHRDMASFLKNSPCLIFHAPFDVRLPRKGEKAEHASTVVQPDICIICDSSKIDDKGCLGAPDLVVEILSPRTAKKDMAYKREVYEEAGVPEYWIVEPSEQFVMVFLLENGRYKESQNYFFGDVIESHAVPGLKVDLSEIFDADAY